MKNIFRFLCLAFVLVVSANLNAQTYRIEAGYLQPVRHSSAMSNRYFDGARLGATVDFQLPLDFMTIHTGLLYSYTFSTDNQNTLAGDSVIYKTKGHYIDIPLHVTASYNLFKTVKAFVFAGPNINVGLYQPQTRTATKGYTETTGITSGESNLYQGDLRRINIQIEGGLGVQWQKCVLKGGYSFGLNDLSKKKDDFQRQSGWYVTAAYEF